jgi:UDP-2-acetamido-3-amino-2,3-dideoxy-glucuronate N-acetyltransferase
MEARMNYVHQSAEVAADAQLGEGTKIWHQAQVREGVRIGTECVIGKGAYIDHDVDIGSRVKIQNGALIYHGVTLEDDVFVGPLACLTNDRFPRSVTPEGQLRGDADWEVGPILVHRGASIGAGAIVLPDVEVGEHAMVGAGAVVTTDVPAMALVVGNPARVIGYACECGRRLAEMKSGSWRCEYCGRLYALESRVEIKP